MRIGFQDSGGNIAIEIRREERLSRQRVRLGLAALFILVAATAGVMSLGAHFWQPRPVGQRPMDASTDSLNASRPIDQIPSSSTLAQVGAVIGALTPRQAGPDQNSAP